MAALEFLFILIIPLAVIMIVIYMKNQKTYSITFSTSAITYIIGIVYVWDEFELTERGVFFMLILSALIMTYLGIYISKIGKKKLFKK